MGGYSPARSGGGSTAPEWPQQGGDDPSWCHYSGKKTYFYYGKSNPFRPYPIQPCQTKEKEETVHPVLRKENHILPPVFPKGKPLPSPSRRGRYLRGGTRPGTPGLAHPLSPVPTHRLDLLLHRRGAPAHPSRPITGRRHPKGPSSSRGGHVSGPAPAAVQAGIPRLTHLPSAKILSADPWASPSLPSPHIKVWGGGV